MSPLPSKSHLSNPNMLIYLRGNDDNNNLDDDVLVIGVDFGTTFSGVAWATAADFASGEINLITSWPGNGLEEGKSPTELYYEHGKIMWGYDIPTDADPVRWFKLLLVKQDDLTQELRMSEYLLRGRKMLQETGKTAVDVIADYLELLFKHTISQIIKARGKSVVDALRFHIVITVPAIWKSYARQGMEKAAKKAGFLRWRAAGETTLTFAPEPEAAVLSTLCEPGRKTKRGEVYVICDAGGGTVDLITYGIDETDPLTIHEAVEGAGGLCGGIFIDEAFENACKHRLGKKWNHLSKAGISEIMKKEWQTGIKPQFNPTAKETEYVVCIPAEAFGGYGLNDTSKEPIIKNGRIHFKGSHIMATFVKSFDGIDKLLDNQIGMAKKKNLKVSGIILVGGLGASPYLHEHLTKRYSKDIAILQSGGMKPWTAICRGAVTKGFLDAVGVSKGVLLDPSGCFIKAPIKVTSTVSRASYGTRCSVLFDKNKHLNEDKYFDKIEGSWMAKNQMRWYLKRGENVSRKAPVRHDFYILCTKTFGGAFDISLYQCEDDKAPQRWTTKIKSLGSFKCKLDIPFSQLPDFKTADGSIAKKVNFILEMIPSGASLEFVVYIGGKKLGSQNVEAQFE